MPRRENTETHNHSMRRPDLVYARGDQRKKAQQFFHHCPERIHLPSRQNRDAGQSCTAATHKDDNWLAMERNQPKDAPCSQPLSGSRGASQERDCVRMAREEKHESIPELKFAPFRMSFRKSPKTAPPALLLPWCVVGLFCFLYSVLRCSLFYFLFFFSLRFSFCLLCSFSCFFVFAFPLFVGVVVLRRFPSL